jgi:CRP-like cAMP-binding protein
VCEAAVPLQTGGGNLAITRQKAAEIARGSGWLSRQTAELQDDLIKRTQLRRFAKGETIYSIGDPYVGVHVLVDGILKVEMSTPGDDYRIATVRQPTFWFGQGASITRGIHLVTMTVNTEAATLFLPQHEFERLVEDAAYCRAFAAMTVEHFEEASRAIGQLLVSDVEYKVAARLAMLAERCAPPRPAVLTLSQAELAEMCGISRVTAQQILGTLESRGLIKTGYRRIEIDDPERLNLGPSLAEVTATDRKPRLVKSKA